MKNFVRLRNYSLRNYRYAFVDTSDMLYKRIFKDDPIPIRGVKEYIKKDTDVRIVICRVPKRDALIFEKKITEIRNKAILLGNTDYANICRIICEREEVIRNERKDL